MNKLFILFVIFIVAFGLTGCSAGITLSVTPNPIDFSSGTDLVNATVTVTTTGMGSLTISRIIAILYDAADASKVLYSYDTDGNTDFPVQIPFVVNGYAKSFELKEYLGDKTINEIIAERGAEIGVTSYTQLQDTAYKLKVEVTTDTATFCEVEVHFN